MRLTQRFVMVAVLCMLAVPMAWHSAFAHEDPDVLVLQFLTTFGVDDRHQLLRTIAGNPEVTQSHLDLLVNAIVDQARVRSTAKTLLMRKGVFPFTYRREGAGKDMAGANAMLGKLDGDMFQEVDGDADFVLWFRPAENSSRLLWRIGVEGEFHQSGRDEFASDFEQAFLDWHNEQNVYQANELTRLENAILR